MSDHWSECDEYEYKKRCPWCRKGYTVRKVPSDWENEHYEFCPWCGRAIRSSVTHRYITRRDEE